MKIATPAPSPSPGSPEAPASPLQTMPPESEPTVCSTRVLIAACLALAFLLMATFALLGVTGKPRPSSVNKASCCLRESLALYRQLNFSVNPCRNLYDHVCDSFNEDPDLPVIKTFEYYSESEFYTKPAGAAGLAVYSLYQSCLADTQNAHKLGGSTAATYIEVLGAKDALRAETEQQLLEFLLRMVVKYDIHTHPTLAVYGRGGFPDFLYFTGMEEVGDFLTIALREPRPHVESKLTDMYDRLRRDCLKSINQLLNISVTLQVMEGLEREIDVNYTAAYVMSNSTLVSRLVPSLTLDHWAAAVRNASGGDLPTKLYHTDTEATQRTLSVLLDVTRLPATLAFFIFKAVSDFLLNLGKHSMVYHLKSVFRVCRYVVSRHPAVTVVAALERNAKGPEHDEAFHVMFGQIVKEISLKAAAILPPKDYGNVSVYLNTLKILLPTEIFPARSVPRLSSDYARNLIALFTSGWAYHSYKRPPGIRRSVSQAARLREVVVINHTVVIPIAVYGALSFNESADDVVSVSAAGVQLADAIWSDVLLDHVWSAETTRMVASYETCQKNLGTFLADRFLLFRLTTMSVGTAIEVLRDTQWTEKFPASELWTTSRSRLFYYLLVHHHYCPGRSSTKKEVAKEVQYIASASEDFLVAFDCPRPNTPTPTCSMAAHS